MEGYEVEADGKVNTIFSALNYCNQMINKGAIIKFIGKNKLEPEFVKFENSLHPFRDWGWAQSPIPII